MNEIIEKEIINIKNMIYEINGIEVMLDSDLAKLYHVETKRINEPVFRNQEKTFFISVLLVFNIFNIIK